MKALSKKEATLKGSEQKLEKELGKLKNSQDELATEKKQIEADKQEITNKLLAKSKAPLKQKKRS